MLERPGDRDKHGSARPGFYPYPPHCSNNALNSAGLPPSSSSGNGLINGLLKFLWCFRKRDVCIQIRFLGTSNPFLFYSAKLLPKILKREGKTDGAGTEPCNGAD